ncbi:leucine rich repeat containing 66 [Salmo trutta]|uniref:Uncharacterized LOC115158515 n=1 Tax=Salmo trutta TaxID=8032 RepID=A0A673XBR2_SALTR|nr:uncharacterized protein LOC115158515 [Salmo trutta]
MSSSFRLYTMQTRRGLFVMAVSQWMFCAAVLLLLIQGLQCSPTPPTCPEPCLCQRGPLLNCSSAGLSQAPQHIPSTVNDLDLSHNLLKSLAPSWPNWGLNNLWLGHNSITHLSLCVGRTWRGKHGRLPLSHNRGRCVSWAPALQLLSAERNQLEMIPEGLGGSEFLQVLQLSHNRISGLQPGDLCRFPHLRELRLQHNHISNLHPHALRDLPELRVLDLSFNLLTTIPPSAYLSLRNLNALVEVSGNRWRCDCSLRSVRRWMAYDRDRALQQTWRGVVCSSPSTHAGRDLLHLEDSDLTCSTAENREGLHQDVTVTEETEILLPCGPPQQDSTWWTTNGQVSGSQTGLLISDITEEDAGLYVCMSGPEEQYISVFNIHVHKTQRKSRGTRSLHWERKLINTEVGSLQREGQETDLNSLDLHRASQRTQSDLVLAVCLSVFITFLLAFILGALARPLLDPLWKRCCNRTKQSSSLAQSVSSAGQGPYDNDAYSDEEAREELGTHTESRVTFRGHPSEIRDQSSIPYYDTVANGRQDNLAGEYDATYENVYARDISHPSLEVHHPPDEKPRAQDSVSSQPDSPETDTHSGELSDVSLSEPQVDAHRVHTHHGMEFEPIPDPEQLQGYRSSSVSSHSDQERTDRDQDMDWPKNDLAQRLEEKRKTQNNPWEHQCLQKEDNSFEQSSDFPMVKQVDVPQIKIGSVGEIPGFTEEPFTDWKPIKADPNPMEPELWNDSGESFEFPDSIRGASAQSSSQDLSGSAFDDQLRKEYEQARNEEPLVKDQRENNKLLELNLNYSGNEPTVYTVNPETEVVKEKMIVQNVGELIQEVQSALKTQECFDWSSDRGDEPTKYTVNEEHDEDSAQVPDVMYRDPSLSLGDTVSLVPRKALNIGFSKEGFKYQPEPETRSTVLALTTHSAISTKEPLPQQSLPSDGTRVGDLRLSKRLDIQPPQEAPPAAPGSPSSSSESKDETTINQKTEEEKAKVPDSSFSLAGIDVSFAPRRALSIGAAKDSSYHPPPEPESRWSGLGLTSQTAISTKDEGFKKYTKPLPQLSLPKTSLPFSTSSDRMMAEESPTQLYVPPLGRRLDSHPPQEAPPAAPRTPPPSGSSSSSTGSEDETTMNRKRKEKAKIPDVTYRDYSLRSGDTSTKVSFSPRKDLNIGFSSENSQYQHESVTRYESVTRTKGGDFDEDSKLRPQMSLPKTSLLSTTSSDRVRTEEPPVKIYIPGLRRRQNIQPSQEAPPAKSSSSSCESGDETPEHTMKPAKDITDYFSPRRTLNISFNNSASTTDEVERKTGAEDRWDQPRLGKVKALSERTPRDTEESSTDMNVSFSQIRALNINFDVSDSSTDEVGRGTGADYSNPTEEISPSPQLSLYKTSRFFSTPTDEARPKGEYSLQIPLHRKHLVVDIQPPLALPDAPATPPPSPEGEEAAGSGWRSREQQMRAMDGFGCNSMTQGDRSYMGLVVAKPFGISRPYQSVTSETIMTTPCSEVSTSGDLNMTYSNSTLHFETHKEGSEA